MKTSALSTLFLPEESLTICNASTSDKSTPDLLSPSGLWMLPSFINHSCDGNSHRLFYGDVMMVYSLTDLKKDEEITFSYVDVLKPLQDRALSLQHYNFVCKCRLCQLDRSDPNYRRRDQLAEQCMALKQLTTADPKQYVRRIESLVKQMRQSYGSRNELKTQMYFHWHKWLWLIE
uniref:SET domain-containing protein n=1 Tax=Ditylenchus dipsaci TaxID=166011 RepID=A0A915EIZ0_9BILA